jgi:hypothetical protein
VAAFARALVTNQQPARIWCWCLRTISRSRRRTRFRTTAPPIFREVTNPARKDSPEVSGNTRSINNGPDWARPTLRTCANSSECVRRRDLGNAKRFGGISTSTTKAFHSANAERKASLIFGCRRLRRRRGVNVNVRLGFCLGCRRRIHDCGVGLLFLRLFGGRISYGSLFLFARREKRGAQQKADILVHYK